MKIKIKEIRELAIRTKEGGYIVEVYGFFGGGVEIFESPSIEECRQFIDDTTNNYLDKQVKGE